MTTSQDIAAFLRSQGVRPGFAAPAWIQRFDVAPRPALTAEALGEHLVAISEFRLLQLGSFLSTPDGELIAQGVGLVIPPLYGPEYRLVVGGLTHAANLQRQGDLRAARDLAFATMFLFFAGIFVTRWARPNS